MATIYSNRNDNVSDHVTMNPNNTSTWAGGIVPATTDQVYIVGRRTTINMCSFPRWTGQKSITVASTANFAASGFFYTVTDQGQIVKTNRNFSISGTMGPTNSGNDWRCPNIFLNEGNNNCRKYLFKNIRFNYIGSNRYSGIGYGNRGLVVNSYDYWNLPYFDGNVHMMSQDGYSGPDGFTIYNGNGMVRNSVIIGVYCGLYFYYPSSFSGCASFNIKILGTIIGIRSEGTKSLFINYNEISTTDTGIQLYSFRTERSVIPFFNQINYNYIKGTSYCGINLTDETISPFRFPKIIMKNNKIRATDDYSIVGREFGVSTYDDINIMSEHTGSRLSRYRNEGHVSQGDTSSDLNSVNTMINFGRYGYDLSYGFYNIFERDPSRPNILRVYTIQGDIYYSLMGVEIDVLKDNVPLQIHVHFDYRFPWINRLQDDGTDDGRIRVFSIENGTLMQMKYGEISSSMTSDWHTFDETFTGLNQLSGRFAIYLYKIGQNGYVEFANTNATIYCDDINAINVVGNTFDINKKWDQYGSSKGIRPISSGSGSGTFNVKINKNIKM